MILNIIIFLLHLIGFGLLVTSLISGFILEIQYRRASELQTGATILKSIRAISMINPLAILILLITGIWNMTFKNYGILSEGWLTAKIIFFTILIISVILFMITSRKRNIIIRKMMPENNPSNESQVATLNKQIYNFYFILTILLIIILYLSVSSRFVLK